MGLVMHRASYMCMHVPAMDFTDDDDCNGLRCICGQAPYSMDLLRSMGEYLCQVILLWRGYPESLKRANLGYKTCANIPPSHKHCTTKRATQGNNLKCVNNPSPHVGIEGQSLTLGQNI